jgi:hypothetical protein
MGPEPPALTVGTLIRDLFVRYELPSGGETFSGLGCQGELNRFKWYGNNFYTALHLTNIGTIGVQSVLMGVGR